MTGAYSSSTTSMWHGRIDRRDPARAGPSPSRVSALAMAQALLPRYAQAADDLLHRRADESAVLNYPSPGGNSGSMRGYLGAAGRPGPVPSCW